VEQEDRQEFKAERPPFVHPSLKKSLALHLETGWGTKPTGGGGGDFGEKRLKTSRPKKFPSHPGWERGVKGSELREGKKGRIGGSWDRRGKFPQKAVASPSLRAELRS